VRIPILAGAVLVASAMPSAIDAAFITYDLTGSWTGSIKCQEFLDGVKQKTVAEPAVSVTQSGLNIGLTLDFGGGNIQRFAGLANPDAKKPTQKGEFAVVFCGTNDIIADAVPDKLGRMVASTKPNKVKATFKGTVIFSDPPGFVAHHGTCKWKFTRIDLTNPNLGSDCAQITVQGGAR
jgi:hypothetical protein